MAIDDVPKKKVDMTRSINRILFSSSGNVRMMEGSLLHCETAVEGMWNLQSLEMIAKRSKYWHGKMFFLLATEA